MLTREDIDEPTELRFWSYVGFGEPDDCWLWTKGRYGRMGYGGFYINGRQQVAHRVSFLLTFGWLPEYVLHRCDTPLCSNPAHLFAGTHADNMRDMVNRWRKPGKITPFVRKTITDLKAVGLSERAIAERVQLSTSSVYRVLVGEIRYGPDPTI